MADFTIGDYEYTILEGDEPKVRAQVVDKTKTSYANIPSTVSNGGVTYSVTSLANCFKDCTRLRYAPTIPSGVTNMISCFSGCSFLTRDAYRPITIPDGVTNMASCFYNCVYLTNAPDIPDSVTVMNACFRGCRRLTRVNHIPANVTDMDLCFYDCSSLTGNIFVSNNPTNFGMLFYQYAKVFIIPDSLSAAGAATWRSIAAKYPNVHYYTDDTKVTLYMFTATRVVSNGSTTPAPDTGTYAYLVAEWNFTYLPSGVTVNATKELKRDGSVVSTTWTDTGRSTGSGVSITSEAWLYQATNQTRTYELTITFNNSVMLSTTLPFISALLDFHAGGDGMAIGTMSTGPGLEIAMDANFDGDVKVLNEKVLHSFAASDICEVVRDLPTNWTESIVLSEEPLGGSIVNVAIIDGQPITDTQEVNFTAGTASSQTVSSSAINTTVSYDGDKTVTVSPVGSAYVMGATYQKADWSGAVPVSQALVLDTSNDALDHYDNGQVTRLNNMAFLGVNPTGGTANDTAEFWRNLGTGYALITQTGQVNNQPNQWGFIFNYVASSEIHQEWWAQSNGDHFKRGGNFNTTAMPNWTQIITSSGGRMTGQLSFADSGLPHDTSGNFFAVGINAFANGGRLAYKTAAETKSWLQIGTYQADTATDVTVKTATYTNLMNFTLAAGTWIVFCNVEFPTNTTGRRIITLDTTSAGAGSIGWRERRAPVTGGPTNAKMHGVLRPTASTKYYIVAWQNSGGNQSVDAHYQAVRII